MRSESPVVGISSWALHEALGAPPLYGVERGASIPDHENNKGSLSLLDLPGWAARENLGVLQICHFHLPSRDAAYLAELRGAIKASGLTLHAVLIDDGDLTSEKIGQRDFDWIAGWLPVAHALGAAHVRVIAGKTAGEAALVRSGRALRALAQQGEELGVGILTENWFDVLSTPDAVKELLQRCEEEVELLLDFGNWGGAQKYEKLAAIAGHASCCHAKAELNDAKLNEADYRTCLSLPFPAGFAGPFILVNGGEEGIPILRDFIRKAS
jgi:hypothetical protein